MDTIEDIPNVRYLELIRQASRMSPVLIEKREGWFERLGHPDKENLLFELEMLLRGVVCFGDQTNHPGPRKRQPVETRKFDRELRVFLTACERIADICHGLLSEVDETQDDIALMPASPLEQISSPILNESLDQDTPEQSLRVLRRTFTDLADIVGLLVRLDPVPHRGFAGVVRLAGREIGRNAFFDPLRLLEFRPEYDRLRDVELLDVVSTGGPTEAQNAITFAFLALLRLLRYLDFAERFLADESSPDLAWIPLATIRSEGQAAVQFMRGHAPKWMAGGFEQQVLNLRASQISRSIPQLEQDYHLLHEFSSMLLVVGDQLGLELRKAYEQTLRPIHADVPPEEAFVRTELAIDELREFLKWAIVTLAQVFEPRVEARYLFEGGIDERAKLERLRRDVWIFSQVLRAFLAKSAAAAQTANRWEGTSSYKFVRDFVAYFKNLGYHLLRALSYWRHDELMSLVEASSFSESLEQDFIDELVRECGIFLEHLGDSFEALSDRPELQDVEFDRHGAAETLRLYLDR